MSRSTAPKGPPRCALFARYSSKMQDDLSIDAQLHEMEAHAAKQGWEVAARYMLPETRSCDLEKSAEWEKMMAAAKAREWTVLLLHKLDRLGRDRDMVVMTKALLRRQGVEIRSVVENLNDSIEHRMLEGVFEIFSDFYARNLGNETKKGHRQLVRQGFWTGGTVPYGLALEVVEGGKKPHKRLIACPHRADVVRTAFAMLANGKSSADILDWIEATTGEPRWNIATFYTRIRNPIYYGRLEYERTSMPTGRKRKENPVEQRTIGSWEGLVTEEVWRKANDVLTERGSTMKMEHRKRPDQPYLLSKLVTCSACQAPIVGSSAGRAYRYYYCSRRRLGCVQSGLRTEELEQAVIDAMRQAISTMDVESLRRSYQESLEPYKTDSVHGEAELRRQLAEVRGRQRKLLEAIETGTVTPDLVGDRLRQLKAQEGPLVDQIATHQLEADARVGVSARAFDQWLEQFREDFQGAGVCSGDQLLVALKHLFHVEVDIKEGRGQLLVVLPPSGGSFGIHCGRSARSSTGPKLIVTTFLTKKARPFMYSKDGV